MGQIHRIFIRHKLPTKELPYEISFAFCGLFFRAADLASIEKCLSYLKRIFWEFFYDKLKDEEDTLIDTLRLKENIID